MKYTLLRIDLSHLSFREEYISYDNIIRKFLGGRGLGAYLMLKEMPKGVDPLSPQNKLYILSGPLSGVVPLASSRLAFVSKSPLTNSYTHSKMSGNFAYWLRKSGFDGVVIEGMSNEPIYISIVDGVVEFHDAKYLMGKTASETEEAIRKKHNCRNENDCGVVTIGPAGENKVRFSSIMGSFTKRAAGRGGLGAVMGSKNVKAIYVYGKRDLLADAVDRKTLLSISSKVAGRITKSEGKDILHKYGTSALVNVINSVGGLPVKNFQTGVMPTAEKVSGEVLADMYLEQRHGCALCPIACTKLGKSVWEGKHTHKIKYEYESVWALGPNLGIDDPDAVLHMINIANEYGMDTISLGNTLACAMELAKKGKLDLHVDWGNAKGLGELIVKIARREGIGNELAEGDYRLAHKYDAPEAFVGSRGQGFPAYDMRALKSFVIAFTTANRGGDHNEAWPAITELASYPYGPFPNKKFDPLSEDEEKIVFTVWQQHLYAVYDSLAWCNFVDQLGAESPSPGEIAQMLNAYAGWDMDEEELLTVGERIFNAERLFHVKEGIWVRDELPPRMKEPMPEGPAKGESAQRFFEWGIKKYYELRGWVDGKPSGETLKRLGLEEFAGLL